VVRAPAAVWYTSGLGAAAGPRLVCAGWPGPCGAGTQGEARPSPPAMRHPFCSEVVMTDTGESPQDGHAEAPYLLPHAAALPDPVATPQAVQQLRDAGFPDAEQARLPRI